MLKEDQKVKHASNKDKKKSTKREAFQYVDQYS